MKTEMKWVANIGKLENTSGRTGMNNGSDILAGNASARDAYSVFTMSGNYAEKGLSMKSPSVCEV